VKRSNLFLFFSADYHEQSSPREIEAGYNDGFFANEVTQFVIVRNKTQLQMFDFPLPENTNLKMDRLYN